MSSFSYTGQPLLTPEQLCDKIELALEGAEKSEDSPLQALSLGMNELRKLRRLYRSRRNELADLEPRLKSISTRLDKLAEELADTLADDWIDIDKDIRDLQNEREACRELLLRLAKNRKIEHLQGETHAVQLQIRSRLEVPPIGTPARRDLENLLRSSPVWVECSEIRPLQLMRLWKHGSLHPHLAHRVNQICRLVETLVVKTDLMDESAGAEEDSQE